MVLSKCELQCSLALQRSGIFSVSLVAKSFRSFSLTFHWIQSLLFKKSVLFIIIVKDKFSKFLDCHFLIALAILRVYMMILGKPKKQKKKKEKGLIWMKKYHEDNK